jgi:hypothetical protein
VALQSITAKNQSWSVTGGTRRCRTSHYTHVITNCIRAPQMAPQSGPLRHLLAISCHLMHHNCHLTPIKTVILHTIGHGCHLTNHYTVIFQPVTATLHTLRSSSHRSRNDARLNDAMCVATILRVCVDVVGASDGGGEFLPQMHAASHTTGMPPTVTLQPMTVILRTILLGPIPVILQPILLSPYNP